MHKCRKKGKITCSNDLSALKHLMLISQAPSRFLTGETIALNSKQLINVKKANCNHGVTGQPKEVTRSLSDCVTWCSKNLKIKIIGPSIEFANMSIRAGYLSFMFSSNLSFLCLFTKSVIWPSQWCRQCDFVLKILENRLMKGVIVTKAHK